MMHRHGMFVTILWTNPQYTILVWRSLDLTLSIFYQWFVYLARQMELLNLGDSFCLLFLQFTTEMYVCLKNMVTFITFYTLQLHLLHSTKAIEYVLWKM
jgi:hypothetical protein